MAVTWTISNGQPPDSTGSDGDMDFDYAQRIQWGPKGRITPGSWVGTANNTTGPVGPAMLSGIGAPGSGYGQNGNGYTDTATGLTYYKSNGSWTQAGSIIGPTGPQGPSVLGSAGLGIGPVPSASSFGITSTATVLPLANVGALPCTYQPSSASAFMGGTFGNLFGTSVTFELYNSTTSTSVYQLLVASGTITTAGPFTTTQYPLVSGNNYVWRASSSSSGTAALYVLPTYLTPSNSPSASVTYCGTAGFSSNTTFTSTPQILPVMGNTSACPWEIRPFRSAYVYQVIGTFTPTGTTSSSATVSVGFYGQGTGANTTYATYSVPATGVPTVLATLPATSLPMAANSIQYYWRATGASVTGYLQIETLAVL